MSQAGLTPGSDGSFAEFDATTGALLTVHTETSLASATQIIPTPSGVWALEPTASLEFDATTGDTLATTTPPPYAAYTAAAAAGKRLWVTSNTSSQIVLLSNVTGAQAAVLYSSPEEVFHPAGIATDQSHVWVSEAGANAVTEFTAGTEAFVRVIQGPTYQFDTPGALASNGTDVFVASASGIVTEFDATSGAFIKTIPVTGPDESLAIDTKGHLWVQTATGLTGYRVSDGTTIASVPVVSSACNFTSQGSRLYVAEGSPPTQITAVNMATGTTRWATQIADPVGEGCGVTIQGSSVLVAVGTGDAWGYSISTGVRSSDQLSIQGVPDGLPPPNLYLDYLAADPYNVWSVIYGPDASGYVLSHFDLTNTWLPTGIAATGAKVLSNTGAPPTNLTMGTDGANLWLIDGTQLSVTGPHTGE